MAREKLQRDRRGEPGSRWALLVILLPLVALMILNFVVVGRYEIETRGETLLGSTDQALETTGSIVRNAFQGAVADLLYLQRSRLIAQIANAQSSADIDSAKELSAGEFLSFLTTHEAYDQLRLLDAEGLELIRANQNEGSPELVPDEELQFKGDRYYVHATAALPAGGVFVSPLDLNVEHGEIERPLKPMIRFSAPIYDADGALFGAVVLNYRASQMLDLIRETAADLPIETYLANAQGEWLIGPAPELEWQFMHTDLPASDLPTHLPDMESAFTTEPTISVTNPHGVFRTRTIYPMQRDWYSIHNATGTVEGSGLVPAGEYYWTAIAHLPRSQLLLVRQEVFRNHFFAIAVYVVIVLVIATAATILWVRRLRTEAALRKANQAKDKLFSVISHDLRGPIGAGVELAKDAIREIDAGNTTAAREIAEALSHSSTRGHHLMQNLLSWSSSQLGGIHIDIGPVDPAPLVEEALAEAAGAAERKDIELQSEIDTRGNVLQVDRTMILVVLRNLISNAIKFTPRGGHIFVRARESRSTSAIVVSVADSGIGIPTAHQAELFEVTSRFRRPGTEGEASSGLGLVVCREFVSKNNGTIRVATNQDGGASFHVHLPAIAPVDSPGNSSTP